MKNNKDIKVQVKDFAPEPEDKGQAFWVKVIAAGVVAGVFKVKGMKLTLKDTWVFQATMTFGTEGGNVIEEIIIVEGMDAFKQEVIRQMTQSTARWVINHDWSK